MIDGSLKFKPAHPQRPYRVIWTDHNGRQIVRSYASVVDANRKGEAMSRVHAEAIVFSTKTGLQWDYVMGEQVSK